MYLYAMALWIPTIVYNLLWAMCNMVLKKCGIPVETERVFAWGRALPLSVTARHEYNYIPMPLPLPLVSVGYGHLSLQATYVPEL